MSQPQVCDLRVWHIPQVPGKPFYVYVNSLIEARKIQNTLEEYDKFQYENNIKSDYSNMNGLQIYIGQNNKLDIETDDGWIDWISSDGDDFNDFTDEQIEQGVTWEFEGYDI